MKVSITKLVTLVCVVCLAGATAACSSGKSSTTTQTSTTPAASQSATPAAPEKINIFVSNNAQQIPAGKSMDIATVKYLAQKTNTDLNITFLPHENYMDQLKLKFASGDIPDVHMVWGIETSDLVINGLALDLKPLIDKYGPNLKKNIPQSAWDAVTLNGKILAIPQLAQGNAPAERVIYVRKDWMDKLGIKEPKTSDEFLDMLRAFRDKDPNGNGKKDEVPFASREKFEWADNIFGMYGVNLDSNTLYNNEVMPGFVSPNMKKALGMLRTMYAEKLIDNEFLTNTRAIWDQKIKSDLVGSWNHVVFGVWDPWQKELSKLLPDKKPNVVAITTPRGVGYDGQLGRVERPVLKTFVVNKDMKHPEAVVKMFDWLVSDEGQMFTELGIEGQSFTRDGSAIKYSADKDPDVKWRSAVFQMHGFNEQAQKVLISNDEAYNKLITTIETSRKEGITNPTAGMPPSETLTKNADLGYKGSFQEAAAKIILGEKPLDYFDEYVASWKKQGGDKAIKELTDWYNANRKK
ncbi:extracellular solute-binding protein [Paenibacillus frigoriresistens]|uniref:extracellular solute-binding protein n=1 Tax=Paenibacillus alginolyticus TaxID=59839 RepID=UPI0015647CDA|nr:extracellular solute-binding protein [Paenibacillus frigoriresistens]NRF91994.1 extracellular solute-binding protein [Paenibacillus frigoriresistens]